MPEVVKPIWDWLQTNLGATIGGGLLLAAVGGLIGLLFRRGQGRQDSVDKGTSTEPVGKQVVIGGSTGPSPVIIAERIGELHIHISLGQPTPYLDGLLETRDPDKKALFEQGRAHQEKNEHAEAIQDFRACLVLFPENSHSERAALLILIGTSFALQGRLAEAEGTCQEALAEAKVGSDREGEAAALGNLGVVDAQKGDLDQALKHLQQALAIHRELEDRRGEAAALGNLGIVYRQQGEMDKALEHLQQALAIHRELEDLREEARTLGNLGDVYYVKPEIDKAKALEYYQAALKIDREIGYRLGEAKQLGSIGNIYADEGKPELARQYYQDALKIQQESRDSFGEAQTLGNLGLVYLQKGELDKALELHQAALEIFRAIGAKAEAAKVEKNIAQLKARK